MATKLTTGMVLHRPCITDAVANSLTGSTVLEREISTQPALLDGVRHTFASTLPSVMLPLHIHKYINRASTLLHEKGHTFDYICFLTTTTYNVIKSESLADKILNHQR